MDLLHPRCAGLDVSKRDAKVCVRLAREGRAGATSTVTTWSSMTGQILALREHLIAEGVTLVVMETTGDYWKPFYYLLEDAPFEVLLVNARQVKNVPGRKTDVSDATWLAQLGAHGLVRGSFVPPRPVRELRDPDPHPDRDHPGTDPGMAAAGEAARRRRGEADLGRYRHQRPVRPGYARRAHHRAVAADAPINRRARSRRAVENDSRGGPN